MDESANRTRRNLLKAAAKLASVAAATAASTFASPSVKAAPLLCFLKGTHIMTVDGPRPIEKLVIGDRLPTVFSGNQAIKWIGRFSYTRTDGTKPWVHEVLPVRVAKSAIAPNVPANDLFLSSAHALHINGALVPVGSLINGTTIAVDASDSVDTLEYFHIKLERHDVILAEGAPCETLLNVSEAAQNFSEYCRLYGEPDAIEQPCAPLMSFNGGRSEVKSRLRSAVSPWIDCRTPLDRIRDEVEERGLSLKQERVLA